MPFARCPHTDCWPFAQSVEVLKWLSAAAIETALVKPGKAWQNGNAETLNGKFRGECLSTEWFRNRTEAKVMMETWRRHYNEDSPHSSLGYQTLSKFMQERR